MTRGLRGIAPGSFGWEGVGSPWMHDRERLIEENKEQVRLTRSYIRGVRLALGGKRRSPPTTKEDVEAVGLLELSRRFKHFLRP